MEPEPETEPVKLPKNGSFYYILYISNSETTVGGFKSDRNGFTKMRVTALIIVRLLWLHAF